MLVFFNLSLDLYHLIFILLSVVQKMTYLNIFSSIFQHKKRKIDKSVIKLRIDAYKSKKCL